MNKTIIVFAVIFTTILLIYIPIFFGDTSQKIEDLISKLDYSSIDKIECNNIKLKGKYGYSEIIKDSLRLKQFSDLLKETNSKESEIGISPNRSKHHTNCKLFDESSQIIISVSMGAFDDGNNFTSIYKSNFIVHDKKIRNSELANLILKKSDEYFE